MGADEGAMRLLFGLFMGLGNFVLLNLFMSVVNESVTHLRERPQEVEFDEDLYHFLAVSLTATSIQMYIAAVQSHLKQSSKWYYFMSSKQDNGHKGCSN